MLLFLLQDAKPAWYADPMVTATVVVALATVVNVAATLLLWLTTRRQVNITRDMFEASHRPYVGVIKIQRFDFPEPEEDDEDVKPLEYIVFQIVYKNVGSVPAHSFQPYARVVVDGTMLPIVEAEEEAFAVLLPGIDQFSQVKVDDPKEVKQIENAATLSLIVKCTYKGVAGKEYSYEKKATYEKKLDDFTIKKVTAT